MQVPVELVIWIASVIVTGLGATGTVIVHLLIRIFDAQTKMATKLSVLETRIGIEDRERVNA